MELCNPLLCLLCCMHWYIQLVESGDRLLDSKGLKEAFEDEKQWDIRPIDPRNWLPKLDAVTLNCKQVRHTLL